MILPATNIPDSFAAELNKFLGTQEFSRDPYPLYHRLRSESPVCWTELWGCWLLTRYDHVTAVLQDHQTVLQHGPRHQCAQTRVEMPIPRAGKPLIDHYSKGLINVDPPRSYAPAPSRPKGLSAQDLGAAAVRASNKSPTNFWIKLNRACRMNVVSGFCVPAANYRNR